MGDAGDLLFGKPPFLSLFVGAKASGKSELIRYVCYSYARYFSYIVVFSPTSLNGFYNEFLPAVHIHPDYDEGVMVKILQKQGALKKAGKDVQCLVVFDDILGSSTIDFDKRKANTLNTIWAANRHWNLSAIVVTQKLKGIPKLMRENCDYCCILRTMRSSWPDLHESFGHVDRKEFEHFLEDNTANYKIVRYKSAVSHPSQHYSVFELPPGFTHKKFKLNY
jgi:hypothetical protein